MHKTGTKYFQFCAIVLVTLLLSACGRMVEGTEKVSTSISTVSITNNSSQTISTTQTTAVAEPEFSGNDDFFNYTEHVIYENCDGITFELLSSPYKLGDSLDYLGVRVVGIDEKLYILNQSPYLNIDKKINGEWVRLEINYGENAKANGSVDEVGRNRRSEVLSKYNVYHMFDCEIIPALTAGEYRFVVYFHVGKGNSEIRQYYIPFEVVE